MHTINLDINYSAHSMVIFRHASSLFMYSTNYVEPPGQPLSRALIAKQNLEFINIPNVTHKINLSSGTNVT